jgi:hypothetical protein
MLLEEIDAVFYPRLFVISPLLDDKQVSQGINASTMGGSPDQASTVHSVWPVSLEVAYSIRSIHLDADVSAENCLFSSTG